MQEYSFYNLTSLTLDGGWMERYNDQSTLLLTAGSKSSAWGSTGPVAHLSSRVAARFSCDPSAGSTLRRE